jgi:hypothetical protein
MTVSINVISFPKHKTIGKGKPKERNFILTITAPISFIQIYNTQNCCQSNEEKWYAGLV